MALDLSMTLSGLVIVVLLALASFFSMAETSLTAASRPRLHHLIRKGVQAAVIVRDLQNRLSQVIGTLLICNTLTNVALSSLATGICIEIWGETGVVYATLIMGALIILYAEVMPKIYGLHCADQVALRWGRVIRTCTRVIAPVTFVMDILARRTLAFFGVRLDGPPSGQVQDEELRGAIELHAGQNQDEPEERAMLNSILDLGSVTVSRIMTHRRNVVMVDLDDGEHKVIHTILGAPYTRIPLCQGNPDNITGILHARSLLKAVALKRALSTEEIQGLASKPWFVLESTSLYDQLQAFRERREHFAIVVDEYGVVLGIVTLEDILEEIVGEIVDEYDVSTMGIRSQPDGSFLVEGTVPVRDLNRQFGWDLSDEEASTVAGLLLYETRQIPDTGQIFMIRGFRFEVMKRQRHQIVSVRITPPPVSGGAENGGTKA